MNQHEKRGFMGDMFETGWQTALPFETKREPAIVTRIGGFVPPADAEMIRIDQNADLGPLCTFYRRRDGWEMTFGHYWERCERPSDAWLIDEMISDGDMIWHLSRGDESATLTWYTDGSHSEMNHGNWGLTGNA